MVIPDHVTPGGNKQSPDNRGEDHQGSGVREPLELLALLPTGAPKAHRQRRAPRHCGNGEQTDQNGPR
jgi:hypothetical protein